MDQWLSELQDYETTLEDMATASLDQNFKEELLAIEQWFRVLSEAERTTTLYSLLQQATQVQIRFFITILGQMQKSDPVGALLSPAVFDKDFMASRIDKDNASRFHSSSRAFPPVQQQQQQSQSQQQPQPQTSATATALFPDAAAALAHHRARLSSRQLAVNSPTNNSSTPGAPQADWRSSPRSAGLRPEAGSAWGDRSSAFNRTNKPLRPRSADLSMLSWQNINQYGSSTTSSTLAQPPTPLSSSYSPLRSSQNNTTENLPSYDPLSPFVGGSWASMVNTPMTTMFSQNHNQLLPSTNLSTEFANMAIQSPQKTGNVILDSDVRKYRRSIA